MMFSFHSRAQFTTGNIVIVRLGDGVTNYNGGSAVRCFLDEYTVNGTFVQSVAMPVTTSGVNRRFFLNFGFYGGGLSLSSDNKYLLIAGYDAAEFTQPLAFVTSAIAPRIVARIDKNENINTTTVTGAYSGEAVESAFSTNGTDIWVSGSNFNANGTGGVRYITLGASSSVEINAGVKDGVFSGLSSVNNQLYTCGQGSNIAVGTVGTGLPVTGPAAITTVNGIPTTFTSAVGYFFADLNASVAGDDVLYICYSNGTWGNTITKYSLVSGAWVRNNSVVIDNPRNFMAAANGSTITMFTTDGVKLYSLIDATGYNVNMNTTLAILATAPGNSAFRGIAFAPSVGDVPTAVREEDLLNISKVFQSSASGLQVTWTAKKPELIIISIVDLYGRTVYRSSTKSTAGLNERTLPIQSLAKGSYVVRLTNGKEQQTHQFIKQ